MEGTVTKLSLLFALIVIILTVLIVFVMLNASIALSSCPFSCHTYLWYWGRHHTGLIRKIFQGTFCLKITQKCVGLRIHIHGFLNVCVIFLFVYMCCFCISAACVLMLFVYLLFVYLWYYLCIRIFSFLVFVCGGLGCNQRQCCLLYESDPPIVCDPLFNNTNIIIIIIVYCYLQFQFWLFNCSIKKHHNWF